jgi:hypothetical protein
MRAADRHIGETQEEGGKRSDSDDTFIRLETAYMPTLGETQAPSDVRLEIVTFASTYPVSGITLETIRNPGLDLGSSSGVSGPEAHQVFRIGTGRPAPKKPLCRLAVAAGRPEETVFCAAARCLRYVWHVCGIYQ